MRRTTPRQITGIVVLAALWVMGPGGLEGQIIRGVVRDVVSGRPVVLAYVGLLAPGEDFVRAGLADDSGHFSLEAPSAGSYFLYVSRHGYRPVMDGVFELGEGGVMELQVGMKPLPLYLDSMLVAVEGESRDLRSVGFYQRRSTGVGHFLEREDIERAAVEHLADALHDIPRLEVVPARPAFGLPTGLLSPEIRIRRSTGSCSPTLYVDGRLAAFGSLPGREDPVRPDDYVDPSRVEAVEVYAGPAEIPIGYQAAGGCGVILIWTRMGGGAR
ncbi:MAG TPA: carboxypeptidase regulatory-like domain-containing protein [Longimicrobiales bacterium]|nr:carboxypeptidase regulatory-like domain-containing protein [Longimicrobiales bacterium]